MSDLLARLIAEGTPAELVAEVAMLLAEKQVASEAISKRRAADSARQEKRRAMLKGEEDNVTSRDITGQHVTKRDEPSLSLPPKDINSNPPTHTHPVCESPRTREAIPKSDQCAEVFESWNSMAREAARPVCQKLTTSRRKLCQARLRDDGLQAIQSAIQRIPQSEFLRGETGDWPGATIDFLLRPDTVTKILEGKYDDRPERPSRTSLSVSKSDGSRGERRNPLLDMLFQAEAEGRAERDQEADSGTWPPLRTIGQG